MKRLAIVLILALSFSNLIAQKNRCQALNLPKEQISDSERISLLYMYEEEKLAGDVYKTLNKQWNIGIFTNISGSEEMHQNMVASLLDKYEITYVRNSEIGKFENEDLQKLYKDLVEKGNQSIEEALTVGATIEDLDIFDIDQMLKNDIDNEDIQMVYKNLRRGSTNHMRAFNRWLSSYNISYKAQYISDDELIQIISE